MGSGIYLARGVNLGTEHGTHTAPTNATNRRIFRRREETRRESRYLCPAARVKDFLSRGRDFPLRARRARRRARGSARDAVQIAAASTSSQSAARPKIFRGRNFIATKSSVRLPSRFRWRISPASAPRGLSQLPSRAKAVARNVGDSQIALGVEINPLALRSTAEPTPRARGRGRPHHLAPGRMATASAPIHSATTTKRRASSCGRRGANPVDLRNAHETRGFPRVLSPLPHPATPYHAPPPPSD